MATVGIEPDTVLRSLVDEVPPDVRVREVRIGPMWTVAVTDVGAGLASTFAWACDDRPRPLVAAAGTLAGRPVHELVASALEGSPLEMAVAMAAVNASLPRIDHPRTTENAVEVLTAASRGRRLAVIGHFPFVDRLRAMAEVDVFELAGRLRPGDLPSAELEKRLVIADVVAITATTLLNHSLENILGWCRPDALRVMLGPTTPLHPAMWTWGLDVLSGVEVHDAAAALRCAAEGATLRQMGGLTKVTWRRPEPRFR